MKTKFLQQDKKHLSLCVDNNYRDLYFFFVKNKIENQLDFLSKKGIEELQLEQSNISESCYLYLYFSNAKIPKVVKISDHYSDGYSDFNFNLKLKEIKMGFHFNDLNIEIIKR